MFEAAIKLLKEIESFGYEAYLVGGFVRDYKFFGEGNFSYNDIDIATNIPLDILRIYQKADISKNKNGFDVIIISYEGFDFEVSSFRGKTIEEDLSKRDFTINSLAMDSSKNVIGSEQALYDIDYSFLRMGEKKEYVFIEDPLRVLRGCRFATKYHLRRDVDTWYLMKDYVRKLKELDGSRVFEEVMKGFALDDWDIYYNLFYTELFEKWQIYEFGHKPLTEIERFIYAHKSDVFPSCMTVPNEVKELHFFYENCRVLEKKFPENNYETYRFLTKKNKTLWNGVKNIFIYEGKEDFVEKCEELIERGDSRDFVTGDEVMDVLNISSGKKVGEVLCMCNSIIMDDETWSSKKEELIRLNV